VFLKIHFFPDKRRWRDDPENPGIIQPSDNHIIKNEVWGTQPTFAAGVNITNRREEFIKESLNMLKNM